MILMNTSVGLWVKQVLCLPCVLQKMTKWVCSNMRPKKTKDLCYNTCGTTMILPKDSKAIKSFDFASLYLKWYNCNDLIFINEKILEQDIKQHTFINRYQLINKWFNKSKFNENHFNYNKENSGIYYFLKSGIKPFFSVWNKNISLNHVEFLFVII